MAEDSDNALLPRIGGGGIPAPVLVNPLAAQNAGIQSAQGLWGIREKQAQEAIGGILQQATDEKGNVDYPKAQLLAKQAGPVVQMGLMSALKDTSGLRGQQITQAGALHGLVGNMAASLMNDPSDANLDKIDAAAAAAGLPATARAEIARIRALPPEQRGAEAYKHVVGNLTALEQLTRGGYQTPVVTQFGGTSAPVTIQPGTPYNPPGMAVGGSVPHTLSPEGQAQYQQWLQAEVDIPDTNTGAIMKGTRLQFFQKMGVDPKLFYPGGSGGGGGGGGGQATSPNVSPNTRPTSTTTTTTPSSGTPIQTPSQDQKTKWEASANQYTKDNEDAGNYQQRTFPLAQAAALLQRGNVTTGEGAEGINRAKSFLMTRLATFGFDAQTVSNSEGQELGKYMTQYVNQQGFSQKSDAALASAISGNPSMHLNTMTNKDVIAAMAGMERMKQMMITDFKNQGGEGRTRDWSDFKAKWQNEHDPRAFVVDFLDGPRRQKMLASMTPEQKANFNKTLTLVEKNPGVMGLAAMPGH